MGKPRLFTTLPVGAIADSRLTSLDLRCMAAIALRDGMSGMKGKGGGCYAKHATLAADAQTDVTNFSKSLSRLIGWGYVVREPQLMDKRRFTLRVVYPDPEKVGEPTNHSAEIVGEETPKSAEIVGERDSENGGFSRQTDRHYSSLREELDSVETGELNSLKGPHLSGAAQSDEFRHGRADPVSWQRALRPQQEKDTAKAGLGDRSEFAALLPANIDALNLGAQVSRYEKAFDGIDRDPDRLTQPERERLNNFLFDMVETLGGTDQDAVAQQAQRLLDETIEY